MENDIENLIEKLTKVRPEMLNKEALKLFNTIMAVLDERDIWIEKINNKISSLDEEIEYQKQYGNVITREKLEYKKEIYLELLEDK